MPGCSASILGLVLALPQAAAQPGPSGPQIVFDLPPVAFEARNRPVTWTIRVEPPTLAASLPEGLTVDLTIRGPFGGPRTLPTQRVRNGLFVITLVPDPYVEVGVCDLKTHRLRYAAYLPDCRLSVGDEVFQLSDLESILCARSVMVRANGGYVTYGDAVRGLGQATRKVERTAVTIDLKKSDDLNAAFEIQVLKQPSSPASEPPPTLEAVVEAKRGTEILASLTRRGAMIVRPADAVVPGRPPAPLHIKNPADDDARWLAFGAGLSADGIPRGAGKEIRPTTVALPAAITTPGAGDAPLERLVPGVITDVACGGGGRYLLLSLEARRKLAVFDVSAMEIVKLINLPAPEALVAAGARKMLIAFPRERVLQRWDLATLKREGSTRPSPIGRPIKRLVLGCDSDGPAVAYWPDRFISFIDLDSLKVMKIGSIRGTGQLSASGGSAIFGMFLDDHLRVRASAGGSLFTQWNPGVSGQAPLLFSVHGDAITTAVPGGYPGQLFPGPDGLVVYTGSGSRLDVMGKPIGSGGTTQSLGTSPMTIPTPDPALYLSISGLPQAAFDANSRMSSPPGDVTVSVHAASDGSRLLTVYGLNEMATSTTTEDWYRGDFTAEKRFHFIPDAQVLVTIPPSNDRLLIRRLDVDRARGRIGRDRIAIVSLPTLSATAGRPLIHQIEARSQGGPVSFALGRGPKGLEVGRDGKVTWTAPTSLQGRVISAVIVVGDASGDEVFHTLKISVN